MTRFGWTILLLIFLGAAVLVSMTTVEFVQPGARPVATAAPAPVARQAVQNDPERLAVPVAGVARAAIADSWGDARGGGTRQHHGTDIMAPLGTPVSAAAPGTIEKIWSSVQGGNTLYVRSPRRDWIYYYAHLAGYAPAIHEGQVVRTGDPLGYVGDTGNAGPGNYHLHFGLARARPQDGWYQGQDIDPYPYLAGRRLADAPAPR